MEQTRRDDLAITYSAREDGNMKPLKRINGYSLQQAHDLSLIELISILTRPVFCKIGFICDRSLMDARPSPNAGLPISSQLPFNASAHPHPDPRSHSKCHSRWSSSASTSDSPPATAYPDPHPLHCSPPCAFQCHSMPQADHHSFAQ